MNRARAFGGFSVNGLFGATHIPSPSTSTSGKGGNFPRKAEQHVATGDHRGGLWPCLGQHRLIIGQLQIEQRLVQPLPHASETLGSASTVCLWCVSRQPPALPSSVQDQLAAGPEPTDESPPGPGRPPTPPPANWPFRHRNPSAVPPDRSPQPLGPLPMFQCFELFRHARRQSEQMLDRNIGGLHSSGPDDEGNRADSVERIPGCAPHLSWLSPVRARRQVAASAPPFMR